MKPTNWMVIHSGLTTGSLVHKKSCKAIYLPKQPEVSTIKLQNSDSWFFENPSLREMKPYAPNILWGSLFRYPKPTPKPLAKGSSEHKGKNMFHLNKQMVEKIKSQKVDLYMRVFVYSCQSPPIRFLIKQQKRWRPNDPNSTQGTWNENPRCFKFSTLKGGRTPS